MQSGSGTRESPLLLVQLGLLATVGIAGGWAREAVSGELLLFIAEELPIQSNAVQQCILVS